ncbi:MAG TPA: TIGR03790 family protein, partial [Chthoniobacteraceae bacterium]|nr:TIGR03790 family protein [Chthoniobacteraceae bacterium]
MKTSSFLCRAFQIGTAGALLATALCERTAFSAVSNPAASESDAAATLVLYNESDRDSRELARFYAAKRGIPKQLLLGLDCSAQEEISREEYDRTIAEPLRKAFARNGWWKLNEDESSAERVIRNRIRFIAVIRGVPLRIAAALNYAGDKANPGHPIGGRNEAAVDSELVTLALASRNISGAMNNPYYRSFARFAGAKMPSLMLVGRLDAATPATVRRMITDGLAVEQAGLRGFAYIDARGIKEPGLAEGDQWLFHIAAEARRHGTPVILDDGGAMYPVAYPMLHAALYFGWYSENVAGPMADPRFRFEPGAIAVHIHSFSASTLRDPRRYWA